MIYYNLGAFILTIVYWYLLLKCTIRLRKESYSRPQNIHMLLENNISYCGALMVAPPAELPTRFGT
jgi:hypothetical protein